MNIITSEMITGRSKNIFTLLIAIISYSCNNGAVKYNLIDIKENGTDNIANDIPGWYLSTSPKTGELISFYDTIDFKTVYIEHTGEKWADKAQIYKGSSYIEIHFPDSLKVFSYDWPQPAISSDPINTGIISDFTSYDDDTFKSPIIIEMTHKFRNPTSKKEIEKERTYDAGIGIGYKVNGKEVYYNLHFHCKAKLRLKGKLIKN